MRRLLLTLALLSACTGASSSPEATIASGPPTTPSEQALSCGKASSTRVVLAFVHAWNAGDMTALHNTVTNGATLNISTKTQGASEPDSGVYTVAAGWEQIRPFARSQHRAGQRFSFDRLRAVGGQGVYADGLRAAYADGSMQSMDDTKFAYACDAAALHRVVLVAKTPAR